MTAAKPIDVLKQNANQLTAAASSAAVEPPVTVERVLSCLQSARYWSNELPRYANRLQRRADWWSIAAGMLSALTGLAIWTVVVNNDGVWSEAIASVFALASAGCALVPRIKSYGEMAGQARELGARYGTCLGQLTDAHWWMSAGSADDTAIRPIIGTFESVKASKDSLRTLPVRPAGKRISTSNNPGNLGTTAELPPGSFLVAVERHDCA